jgi:interferon-induced GTP-binding protein Mx1
MDEAIQHRCRPLLDLIDDLRRCGVEKHIAIPQIAVMGDQSSGKSSVLEAICKIPFPRGTGLVTRCATQVAMVKSDEDWNATVTIREEGDESSHGDVHRTYTEPGELTACIEELTDLLAGSDGDFSDDVIEIKLRGPELQDLTIIDLPGIVKTRTEGQDDSVIATVDTLVSRYLNQDRTIILAVIPANVDIATVDILSRAEKADPDGTRTIGVLTKPDLVDEGGEAEVRHVLENKKKKLTHGYVMVKNRSQKELDSNTSLETAKEKEAEWFKQSVYVGADCRTGSDALITLLVDILVRNIKSTLPDIEREIDTLLDQKQTELEAAGESPPQSERELKSKAAGMLRNAVAKMKEAALGGTVTPIHRSGGDGEASKSFWREILDAREAFADGVRVTEPGFGGEQDKYDLKVASVKNQAKFEEMHPGKKVGSVISNCALPAIGSTATVGKVYSNEDSDGCTYELIAVGPPYYRGDLAKKMKAHRGRELPGFLSFDVFTSVMCGYVNEWKTPSDLLCESALRILGASIRAAIEGETEAFPAFGKAAMRVCNEHRAKIQEKMKALLDTRFRQESVPATQNHCE